jgi:hypothetical protein
MTCRVLVVGTIWFIIALVLSATGVVAELKPPLPQVVLAGLIAVQLLAFWRAPAFRFWVLNLPLTMLLLPHAVRFVGIYFLALYARGELPYTFAVPGGWGDIVAATGATALACLPKGSAWTRNTYLVWNIFGLVDIVFVVVSTAARLALSAPHSMDALFRLPLSLLPTFFVPLIIFSHVMIFFRLLMPKRLAISPSDKSPGLPPHFG